MRGQRFSLPGAPGGLRAVRDPAVALRLLSAPPSGELGPAVRQLRPLAPAVLLQAPEGSVAALPSSTPLCRRGGGGASRRGGRGWPPGSARFGRRGLRRHRSRFRSEDRGKAGTLLGPPGGACLSPDARRLRGGDVERDSPPGARPAVVSGAGGLLHPERPCASRSARGPTGGGVGEGAMIPAVILAGGLGTRLRPLTDRQPKALVRVQGKPFLQHQLEQLKRGGVQDVLLLVGYRGRQIEETFGDDARLGLRLRYSAEDMPLGTGGALRKAEELLPDDFLLLNGDTLLPLGYEELWKTYRQSQKLGLLVAYENPDRALENNLALGSDRLVTAYHRHNPAGLTHVDAGLGVFSKRLLQFIPPALRVALEEEVYPMLIHRNQLAGFSTPQRFYDMGSFAGLEALERGLTALEEKP